MLHIHGESIYLRALEPEDLDFLYQLENDLDVWEISGTTAPFSKHVLKLYLENAHKDIYEVKQLRLAICNLKGALLGFIDLFDFDPKNLRVGLGIIVSSLADRNKGVGTEAVKVLSNYVFSVLGLRQIYVNVLEDNVTSMHLFSKLGFQKVGVKKDWVYSKGVYKNEVLLQKINC